MGNRVQPGGRVDEQTYERFREWVRSQHGSVRNHLGKELEIAMKERMNAENGADQITRIENDVATVKAMLAEAESDGGATLPTPDTDSDTRPRQTEKPSANQPVSDKVDYLITVLMDDPAMSMDKGGIATKALRNTIKDEYGFKDETVDDIQENILNRLDAVQHPKYDAQYIWGERIPEVRDEIQENVSDELDEVSG